MLISTMFHDCDDVLVVAFTPAVACISGVVGSHAVAAIFSVPCCWRHCFACVTDIACVTAVAYNPAVGGIPAVAGFPWFPDVLIVPCEQCFTSQKLMSRGT